MDTFQIVMLVVAAVIAIISGVIVPVGGAVLAMHWKISNIVTRVTAIEGNHGKHEDEITCLDKKVDEIKVQLGKMEIQIGKIDKMEEKMDTMGGKIDDMGGKIDVLIAGNQQKKR